MVTRSPCSACSTPSPVPTSDSSSPTGSSRSSTAPPRSSAPSRRTPSQQVPLEDLAASGALLTLDPSEVELSSSCTRDGPDQHHGHAPGRSVDDHLDQGEVPVPASRTRRSRPSPASATRRPPRSRKGTRRVKESVSQTTKSLTGSAPGFSLPFLADPDQLVDVLTGEGEVSYFRLDFGSLVAKVAYTQSFGPIMAGPVPIKPFVGGSISVEGRMAAGFDSMPQTLAARSLSHPGDVDGLDRRVRRLRRRRSSPRASTSTTSTARASTSPRSSSSRRSRRGPASASASSPPASRAA